MKRIKAMKVCTCGVILNRMNTTFGGHMSDFGLILFHCHACGTTMSIRNKKLPPPQWWVRIAG